jgi:glutamine amidotransferase
MVAVINYGVGNLFSLGSSLSAVGADYVITSDEQVIRRADKIILPGVGAFEDAIAKLRATGLDRVICDEAKAGKPIMGICLGMQLLFERSLEYGDHKGLGLLRGSVIPMKGIIADELKVPHIGWNTLRVKREHPIFKYVKDGDYVYFVHSYFASECDDSLLSTTDYGVEMCAAVALDNVTGTQFHPEKSGDVGLGILKAFCEWEVE